MEGQITRARLERMLRSAERLLPETPVQATPLVRIEVLSGTLVRSGGGAAELLGGVILLGLTLARPGVLYCTPAYVQGISIRSLPLAEGYQEITLVPENAHLALVVSSPPSPVARPIPAAATSVRGNGMLRLRDGSTSVVSGQRVLLSDDGHPLTGVSEVSGALLEYEVAGTWYTL